MSKRIMLLLTVLALVAAAFASTANAATGQATAQMLMGTVNINAAGGSSFSVATVPEVFQIGESQSQAWSNAYSAAGGAGNDVYTIACWTFSISTGTTLISRYNGWKCADSDTGSATTLANALATTASGTLGTTGFQTCSWLQAYDATAASCNPIAGTQDPIGYGYDSPTIIGDQMPNLDAYVGQIVTFNILTNWCSFIGPSGMTTDQVARDTGMAGSPGMAVLGCSQDQYGLPIGLAARSLAAASNPQAAQVNVTIQADASDCHVPYVKGLTLKHARQRLVAANCGVGQITRVKGVRHNRVRYQPLKVGTGKPRGYKLNLVVSR